MKKVSVIIPIYNSEKTIEKCIKSIENQSYGNIEIIAVNDGSTDNTIRILEMLAQNDNRIKVITIKNGGVSHARNVGIDAATGDFITFVDSDDTIEPSMYKYLIDLIKKYNVKIAHCSYNNLDEKGRLISSVGNFGKIIVMNHDEAMSNLISGKYFAGGTWNKLFSADLFSNLRFCENIKINEDVLLNYQLFDLVEKSIYSDKALYNYYQISSSSCHTTDSIKMGKESLYVAEKICEYSKTKSYYNLAQNRAAYICLNYYKAFADKNMLKISEAETIREKIIKFKKSGVYKGRKKIAAEIILKIPKIYSSIYKFYDKIRVKKLDPEQ